MGIKNFCKLLLPYGEPSEKPDYFDSILIDIQSYLYVAIENSFQLEDSSFFKEICESVWNAVENKLNFLFSFRFPEMPDKVTLILSFDGEGVPMKWPTQRERRTKLHEDRKNFYRQVLFGHNRISLRVKNFVLERLKHYTSFWGSTFYIIVSGSDHWGEGEHKLFQLAQKVACRHPLVVSVDQDVFMLAFMRLQHFESLQIHRYKVFHNVSELASRKLTYPVDRLIVISILFGNDFIPPLVEITDSKAAHIHHMLQFEEFSQYEVNDPPSILSQFLHNIKPFLKFSEVNSLQTSVIKAFWITYLWILDYYTKRNFQQLHMKNEIYDLYDRNQLLTALMDEEYSTQVYREALLDYAALKTMAERNPASFIFSNVDFLRRLEPYWIESIPVSSCSTLLLTKLCSNTATGSRDPIPEKKKVTTKWRNQR